MANFFKRMEEAVKTGDVDQLNRLLENKDHNYASQALSQAAQTGQLECVKFLVEKCSHDEIYKFGLLIAIGTDHVECTNYLLSFFPQLFDCSLALDVAVEVGNVGLVQHFIPFCREQKYGSAALLSAIIHKNKELFDMLLPVSDPQEWDCLALFCAVEENRPEFFDIILPLSDPNAENGAAFRKAVELGYTHFAEMEMLYPLVDLPKIAEYIRVFEPQLYENFSQVVFNIEAKIQKKVLNENIGERALNSVARKM